MTKKINLHFLMAAILVGLVLLARVLRGHPLGTLIAISIIIYTLIFFIRNPNFKWNSGYSNEWIKIRRSQQVLIGILGATIVFFLLIKYAVPYLQKHSF
jgi:hypothetical protein